MTVTTNDTATGPAAAGPSDPVRLLVARSAALAGPNLGPGGPIPAAPGALGHPVGPPPAGGGPLPAEAYAAALAGLSGMGPARLAAMLRSEPVERVWARARSGRGWTDPAVLAALGSRSGPLVERWAAEARAVEPAAVWDRIVRAGVGVAMLGSPAYPPVLAADVEPPGVVFHRGRPDAIAGPRVAIVGSRQCSEVGGSVALEIGRDLARAGVSIVSGLATGIDGAAHRGALSEGGAPPIGVAGSGLDEIYPPGNADLWDEVAAAGVLLSEAPLGSRPERWRFPARNRIIAALADVVVVVEAHRRSGSMYTVEEADRRGIDVLVVPGSVRNPAAAGSNALLVEGRAPVTGADDVLLALGLQPAGRRQRGEHRTAVAEADRPVLDAVGWQPSTLDQVSARSGRPVAAVAPALERLQHDGWITRRGGWFEQVAGGDA